MGWHVSVYVTTAHIQTTTPESLLKFLPKNQAPLNAHLRCCYDYHSFFETLFLHDVAE